MRGCKVEMELTTVCCRLWRSASLLSSRAWRSASSLIRVADVTSLWQGTAVQPVNTPWPVQQGKDCSGPEDRLLWCAASSPPGLGRSQWLSELSDPVQSTMVNSASLVTA